MGFWLWLVLSVGSGHAAESAAPVQVVRGDDLTAWQLLEVRRLAGAEAIAAYRSFILSYDLSPLALAAWGRLVQLGSADDGWLEEARPVVSAVRRRWEAAQRALVESAGRRVVAVLE